MSEVRKALIVLVENQQIAPANANRAAEAAGVFPAGRQWLHFLDRLLLWLGGLALAFSVLFFIAYNWGGLGRLARFAVVEGAAVLAFAGYWLAGRDSTAGKVALLVTALLLGGVLALFGQTYQTGADPWQLFFTWALLMTPFALVGQFAALWVLWAFLLNLSLMLYFQPTGTFVTSEIYRQLLWVQFALNAAMLFAWELLAGRVLWLRERWAARLLATAATVPVTMQVVDGVFSEAPLLVPALVWALMVAALYGVYRYLRQDLFMLTLGAGSVIAVLTSLLLENLLFNWDDSGGVLVIAMALMAMSTLAVKWLRSVHRGWHVIGSGHKHER